MNSVKENMAGIPNKLLFRLSYYSSRINFRLQESTTKELIYYPNAKHCHTCGYGYQSVIKQ
ncbi:MAG: hypothetical protein ACYC49_04410 [Ignavibacteriaceae bacterium]